MLGPNLRVAHPLDTPVTACLLACLYVIYHAQFATIDAAIVSNHRSQQHHSAGYTTDGLVMSGRLHA